MPTIEQLKNDVDCHDLADRLGWKRPGEKGNYSAPNRDDNNPSVSITPDGKSFKDFAGGAKGSCIDMILYHYQIDDVGEAVKILHELYGWQLDNPEQDETNRRERSIPEFIAQKCRGNDDRAIEYLGSRGIDEDTVRHAIKKGTVGFNTYTNPKHAAGKMFHGGPGVAFITKSLNPGMVVGVDVRYLEPALNGGLKTMSHGDKNIPWTTDIDRLKHSHTVYWFESPINALSFDSCRFGKGYAAVATKGTEQAKTVDLHFMLGKYAVICMDNDETNDDGKCPGPEASWILYERLTALGVAVQLVDQMRWKDHNEAFNDANDILMLSDSQELKTRLKQMEEWVIPGMYGKRFDGRNNRVFLPDHDYSAYWRFRAKADFTRYITEMKQREDGSDGDDGTPQFIDLCGFRVAALCRVSIASATSVMSGEEDAQPTVLFAASVQTPRHGARLVKHVFEDDRLHNLGNWTKFGPVYEPKQFSRMINILERGADLGARHAVNFVGLCWKGGEVVVNEGPDCYFTEPARQCPYHNLTFPSGRPADAATVIHAYQSTFTDNAAMILLASALGGHLKAILGFWPHTIVQADKGAGKTTLLKRMERTIGYTLFANQSIQTEFRMLTSISHTSHPVGWEELSACRQQAIDAAVSMLQQSYQTTTTRRGADVTEYLISAPVILAGEDVPVRSLLGKVVRAQLLAAKQGPQLPEDLPRFPVREWLEFLASKDPADIRELYRTTSEAVQRNCRSSNADSGANRMRANYSAVMTAWRLLCAFAGIDVRTGDFTGDLMIELNNHIADSVNDRDPWIWILETIFDEISSKRYAFPHKFVRDHQAGEEVLFLVIRHTHIMSHLKTSMHLRDGYNALPVKSAGVLLKQLKKADVVHRDRYDATIDNRRESHLIALDLGKLAGFGLHVSTPETSEWMERDLHAVPPHVDAPVDDDLFKL